MQFDYDSWLLWESLEPILYAILSQFSPIEIKNHPHIASTSPQLIQLIISVEQMNQREVIKVIFKAKANSVP